MGNGTLGLTDFCIAIETSSSTGSVALGQGADVVSSSRFSKPRSHVVEFVPAIERLCAAHGVEPGNIRWVFVSAGPGSFTGLRIGITAARTMALAVGAKIVAIPTLEVIAQNAQLATPLPEYVSVVLDAKRKRVYTSTFQRNSDGFVAVDQAREADPATYLSTRPRGCAVLGEGVLYHREAVRNSGLAVLAEDLFPPRVETVYLLGVQRAKRGEIVAAKDLTPVYIRPPEAEEVWQVRHGG